MKRIIPVLFFLSSLSLFAQSYTATYTYGDIYLKQGNSWIDLYAGDALSANAVFRLEQGAEAEFQGDSVTILVLKPGTYNMSTLAEQAKSVKRGGAIPIVQSKLKSLTKTESHAPSAVGGVRASEAVEQPAISWFTEDAAEYIEEGKDLLSQGKNAEAAEVLEYGLDAALTKSEEDEVRFYLAYARVQEGDYLKAIKDMNGIAVSPQAYYYSDLYLLKGSILLETGVFTEAAEFLRSYIPGSSSGSSDIYQSILLMEGMALSHQGNASLAKQVLSKAYEIDRTSETGIQAKRLLDNETASR